ncbi:hypothetical protein HETIRDRAFT_416954 [Heterobasidion irregulare TC 32-1]|uniref:Nicotinate phosphoribosyltransferase n=1 Tax=Heterobasidion irregulare (strain TC 32-1) TaxID=747525 RepID=W4KB25_HETIT|nr:uncharacterized protein HETIRDRAFT_416954 [Heterobasidion irregulare TC 32-1]ETW82924.1 hypothetical protein HETIRDRAFT_416954 [Heterobasidion irregulare TC 32-1]
MDADVLPRSLLDTDLYKLTMQQAVLHTFPAARATYRFTHRDPAALFTRACAARLARSVSRFSELALTPAERAWLAHACPYLTPAYLSYLAAYRFDPAQVSVAFVPAAAAAAAAADTLADADRNRAGSGDPDERGRIEIAVAGPWVDAICWEVPLMATLSEIYYRTADTDWSLDGQDELAYAKAQRLLAAGCVVSEFGTRRRRAFAVQDTVVAAFVRAQRDLAAAPAADAVGKLAGTSNVYLAMKHGIAPIGTIAHEWVMGVAALRGYAHANATAMDLWERVYPDALLVALTDTFSSDVFFEDLVRDPARAQRWRGLRQDSGDPHAFAARARAAYARAGVDHRGKAIVYSDALDVDKALALRAACAAEGFAPSFGIGTFLTNDFCAASGGEERVRSRALNIVIKLASVDGAPCVKLSDDPSKNTGDPETVARVKELYGLS